MITPLDIENKKFGKQMMNGYSVEEVDDFLDDLTVDYSKNYKEISELRSKVDELNASLAHYKTIETTLQKCNQSLPKNFIEALGSQWKRKKIKTVQEAIEEGKAYLKYQNQQHHDWDDFTKDIQIVSQEKSTADNIDEDALAMLEKYD